MKKQYLAVISMIGLLLVGCGENNDGPIKQEEPPRLFNSIEEVRQYLEFDGDNLEDNLGFQGTRDLKVSTGGYYTNYVTTTSESIISYSDNACVSEGTIKYEALSTDGLLPDKATEDTFIIQKNLVDDKFYAIYDYEEGNITNYQDSISSYSYPDEIDKNDVRKSTNLGLAYLVYNYIENYISPNILSDDAFKAEVTSSNEAHYEISFKDLVKEDSYGKTTESLTLELTFNSQNLLTYYNFSYINNYLYEDGSTELNNSVEDTYTVYSKLEKEQSTSLPLNPTDYYLRDYEVILCTDDGLGQTDSINEVDPTKFPLNTKLYVKATNVEPQKALDTNLTIVSSSNTNVIGITDGVAKSKATGTTTLTIRSESGIEKTLDVTVVNPPLTSITLNIYSSKIYTGETHYIYVTKNPSKNDDELEFSLNCNEDVATVNQDEDGYYYLETYKPFTGLTITATSKSNPSVSGSITVNILVKMSLEDLETYFVGSTWSSDYTYRDGSNEEHTVSNANTIVFNEDNTGYFINNCEEQGLLFEVGKKYEFTYRFLKEEELDYRKIPKIVFSDLEVQSGSNTYNYDDNYAYLPYDGHDMDVNFSFVDDYTYFAYAFRGIFNKVME